MTGMILRKNASAFMLINVPRMTGMILDKQTTLFALVNVPRMTGMIPEITGLQV